MTITPRWFARASLPLVLTLACSDDTSGDDELGTASGESSSGSESSTTESSSGETSSSETSSSETSSSETDTSTTSDTDTTSSSESDSTTTTGDGDGDAPCPIDPWPYGGPLCGPDDLPCTIAADEELDGPAFRNGAPALAIGDACQVHVLFSVAENGYHGYYGTNAGGWMVEPTPMPVARGGLVVDPLTQVPTAVVDDGAFGVTTWTREGDWTQVASFAGMHHIDHGLVRDLEGTIHAGYRTDTDELKIGSYDGAWSSSTPGAQGIFVNAGVSVPGIPQITAWTPTLGGWQLQWHGLGGSEVVADYGANSLDAQFHAFAVQGGDMNQLLGVPHLLHSIVGPNPLAPHSLAYSTRPSQWTTTAFVDDETLEACDYESMVEGELCDYDYVRHHPLAVVTSESGAVRLLWSRIHHQGTLVAVCEMMGPPFCYWAPIDDTSSGELWIGWPSFDTIEARLLGPSFAFAATAGVDTSGRIHLAVYDQAPADDGSTLRHLRIEP